MRFRYFDGEGIEVEISSVDALAFRIRTGIIGAETLLYDSAVDEWGPAGTHPVFRFVKEEGEGPWPPEEIASPPRKRPRSGSGASPAGAEGLGVPGTPEKPEKGKERKRPGKPGKANGPVAGAKNAKSAGKPEPAAEKVGAEDVDAEKGAPEKRAAEKAAPEKPASTSRQPVKDPAPPPPSPDDGAGSELPDLGVTPVRSEPPPPPAPERASPDAGPQTARGANSSAEPSPWADLMERPSRRSAARPGPEAEEAREAPRASPVRARSASRGIASPSRRRVRRRRVRRTLRVVVGALGVLAVTVVVLFYVSETGLALVERARVGAAGLVAEAAGGDEGTGEGGGAEEAEGPAAEGGAGASEAARAAALSGGAAQGPRVAGGAPAAPAPGPADLPPVEEVTAAVHTDLNRSASELRVALGVPEAPPPEWLHGVYLARASSFPEVADYWERFRVYVTSVRSVEPDLYRGFVQNRIVEMGVGPAGAAELSERALARFRADDGRRQALYADLLDLAAEAEALHALLVEREASIAYEPFTRQGLSRDPVVEAVPEDTALAEELWTRLDGIFERLDRIHGIRPVSTLRLQEALLGGVEVPERAPAVPDSTGPAPPPS